MIFFSFHHCFSSSYFHDVALYRPSCLRIDESVHSSAHAFEIERNVAEWWRRRWASDFNSMDWNTKEPRCRSMFLFNKKTFSSRFRFASTRGGKLNCSETKRRLLIIKPIQLPRMFYYSTFFLKNALARVWRWFYDPFLRVHLAKSFMIITCINLIKQEMRMRSCLQ